MKALSIVAAFFTVILIAAFLVPPSLYTSVGGDPATGGLDLATYRDYLPLAALVAAVITLLALVLHRERKPQPAPRAEAVQPAPPPPAGSRAEAEVITLLATLQQKGRLIDFLMDDITAYNDAQVAAAARVVHEGCRAALNEHVEITPIRSEAEGSSVTVPPGYAADEYRLVGKIAGQAPFTGTLVHRGWRTDAVKLPRILPAAGDRLPTIAPAEIELR